jgi:peptidyl-prolyl cis-trans isomerase SurA
MKGRPLLALFLLASLFLPALANSEIVDRVVAIVNDDIITLKETEKYVPVEKEGRFVSVNEYLRNMKLKDKIGILIDDVLIKQQAKKLQIAVSDRDVQGSVEGIKKQHLITDEQLKEQLKKENIDYESFLESLKMGILRSRVVTRVISPDVKISETAVRDYYNGHANEFRDEEYRLQQIFVSGKRPDGEQRANAAYALLKEGKAFEAVVREFSDDPSKEQGGDIGIIRKEELVPVLRAAVNGLSPGMYTPILRGPYGFQILRLAEVKTGPIVPYDAVKDRIQQRLLQQESENRYKEFIDKLRKASYIEVKL